MFAVVVRVIRLDPEAADAELREKIIPRISQAPGFAAGYWTAKDDTGLAMIVFDSEDAATRASEMIPPTIPDTVRLEGIEVREVVGHA